MKEDDEFFEFVSDLVMKVYLTVFIISAIAFFSGIVIIIYEVVQSIK